MPDSNKVIALRKSDVQLIDLEFNDSLTKEYQIEFETINCTPRNIRTEEVKGTLLNGKQFSHLLYSHNLYSITISANELDEDAIEFLHSFWQARFKYISFRVNSNWEEYIEVITDGGVLPIEYIDGIADLPEISLNFETVNPLEIG